MKTAADGDDYTWEQPQIDETIAPKSLADVFATRRRPAVLNQMTPQEAAALGLVAVDLRTPDQQEREDVAALNLRIDNLVDALEMLTRRVAELERAAVTVKG